ncbi:hypothetical protein JIN86_14410 [Lysinibacillus sp. HST-98]|uniref:hypothetical protein n=1 Tax=Lysinibacillus TaxID=400634 RepID=UPI0001DA4BFD|nr:MULTISPECIES: hypothetical protein [Lysinibacillus]EFI67074.1 hypothetical protein BFZC1_19785 [Lysinibacillus fusiformis ZC1]EKU44305.1 hypothetical protein C518_0943 [Lysinibacillus fusiformis ZB2]MBL3730783.1 hypothetical protein [Lysinibacillus sp. HST-98]MBU5250707.1 hypothetical protein [Lysinibacillus capsici]MED4700799.1 hypothetical protein [Lysinibacillus capsici]
MSKKWLSSILVAIFSIAALVFIIMGKFNFAVLAMTVMFALSNGFRAKSFKEQGYIKEAKWMQYMAIFFAIASIVVFVIVLTD